MQPWTEEKVFKDPVHKYIYVQDPIIWNLINTAEFQRLRRIRQLGTSYLTFHGAEHSRFSHSLGVYELVRKIISQFERNGYEDWPIAEKRLCLCAALLHDIGHGPFSHSIEALFGQHHEEWSCRIILENTEVNEVLRTVNQRFPEQVAEVIKKTYPHEIVISLVSSQLDADRMDYLLRDAYSTGVNYGMYDLERILRVIRPYQGKLVVKESGMHAVEDYLMSRYQMYWQIYFHPVTRSSEVILRSIFRRAQALYASQFTFKFMVPALEKLFIGRLRLSDYLTLDEALMQAAFSMWTMEQDAILVDLCRRFLNRKLLKYVAVEMPVSERIEKFITYIEQAGYDPRYYVEVDYPHNLTYDIYRPDQTSEQIPIMLLDSTNQLVEISTRSNVIRSISGTLVGKYRLYFPEEGLAIYSQKHAMPLITWLNGADTANVDR